MVSRSTHQHDVHRSSNRMHSATQSRAFWLSPDVDQTALKKRGNAPPIGSGSAEGEQRDANLRGEWRPSSAFSQQACLGVTLAEELMAPHDPPSIAMDEATYTHLEGVGQ